MSGFEFGNPYSAISRFELSDKENRECILLTEKEDSILNRQIIGYLQKKITDKINQIISHPDFLKKDIKKLITSDELDIVISDDKKLNAEDVSFIEQEFNDYMLVDGYKSLFRFPKFKEFIKSIANKEN